MKKSNFLLSLLSISILLGGCKNKEENENKDDPKNDEQTEINDDKKETDEDKTKDEEKVTYTISWNNYDGTLIESTSVEEGTVPSCSKTPSRSDTEEYTYTFSGWNPTVSSANADVTYTATYTETKKTISTTVSTIQEVRELCKNVTTLNEARIGFDKTVKVTIQGWAFHKMTLVKTAKKFGYDVSYPNKVFLGDSTGYIACASSNNEGSLYAKVANYAGNEKSKYEVTGYISMYMNQPEIYIPEGDDQVGITYNEKLSVTADIDSFAVTKTIAEYYEGFSEVCYNCAGHGYKDIVKINNVSIADVVDSDTYIGTDGDRIIKIKKGLCRLSKGKVYNIVGLVQTNDFIPSINLFSYSNSEAEFTYLKESSAIETTISEYIKTFNSLPFEDTKSNMSEIIKKFQYAYKIEGYVSAFDTNGKKYVTLEPNYNTSKDYPTKESAICVRGAVVLKNDNCWNVTEDEIIRFACIGDYFNENVTASIYVTPILYENMTYSGKKYHMLKNYAFAELIPEFVLD